MKRIFRVAIVLIAAISFVGCSLFRSHTQKINVSCSESDAKLFLNDKQEQNPVAVDVPRNKEFSVKCHKEGYQVATKVVSYHLNDTGILDIIGGVIILIPFFGLLSPGAYSLDETDVNVQMFTVEKK